MLYRNWHYVVAGFCAYNVWIFAVLKQWLLQQRETEASFVYIFFIIVSIPTNVRQDDSYASNWEIFGHFGSTWPQNS